mmetsp:Transcript_10710/g.12535  ORF Transcript_10710/g.12535 Transcript_10710/m.12535 type:complete len:315 (+) Transcript_10710:107-1051(+)|eukprot:CAMPEP_0197851272 /NCGR_PEP_ID=MMETSP1438-20131217/17677_1 /TAXON_ID=1461541 /ORGANISM="Pterosperma sp., Strain CCMP1384" /LENGTH=314 /DNA_ID=CAMNT_0043464819 /DNA_START=98 /DNA_END=1042 /DNA_ORIENTATION=+
MRGQRSYTTVLLVAFLVACGSIGALGAEEKLPGWLGEVPPRDRKYTVEVLGWAPRAFLFHNFLSEEEADYMVKLATPAMLASTVVDSSTGNSVSSSIRTSSGTFLQKAQDEVIENIERRIAEASMVPEDQGEGLQILHYQKGQKYEAHYDFFHDKFNATPDKGGQRIATMLMYLSTPEAGGETVFPTSKAPAWQNQDDMSTCAKRGLAVKAKKGDALLFWSLKPDGTEDTSSLHAGCPVIRGDKWSATKWMHVANFGGGGAAAARKSGKCEDANPNCKGWAGLGECTNNPVYMLDNCIKSCNKCPTKGAKKVPK